MISNFTVPLTSEAYYLAEKFKKNQNNEIKAKQVYLNTLAVYAGNFYCKFMGIETNWKNSDSSQVTSQILMDVADLDLTDLGKLECRPILPNQKYFDIPEEARENDRLGCLIIEINEAEKKAIIKKFCQTEELPQDRESIPVENLQSLDSFLDYVEQIENGNLLAPIYKKINQASKQITKITEWFDNVYSHTWQKMNSLLNQHPNFEHQLAMGFRYSRENKVKSSIKTGKIINISDTEMVLCADIQVLSNQLVDVVFRIYPSEKKYLPPDLIVSVFDNFNEKKLLLTGKAKEYDDWMQIKLKGEVGEKFSLDIELNANHMVENFEI